MEGSFHMRATGECRFQVQLVAFSVCPDAEILFFSLKIVLYANTKLEGPRFGLIGDQCSETQKLKDAVTWYFDWDEFYFWCGVVFFSNILQKKARISGLFFVAAVVAHPKPPFLYSFSKKKKKDTIYCCSPQLPLFSSYEIFSVCHPIPSIGSWRRLG